MPGTKMREVVKFCYPYRVSFIGFYEKIARKIVRKILGLYPLSTKHAVAYIAEGISSGGA